MSQTSRHATHWLSGSVGSYSEIDDVGRSRYPCWCWSFDGRIRLLEAVFYEQVQIVALVEHLALDIRACSPQLAYLSILLSDELLTHGCYLDIHIVLREVKVRSEERCGFARVVPVNGESGRFVLPVDRVEI